MGFSFAWCVLLSFVVDSVDGLLVRSSSSFAALRACRANGVCCDLRGPSPPCPALPICFLGRTRLLPLSRAARSPTISRTISATVEIVSEIVALAAQM